MGLDGSLVVSNAPPSFARWASDGWPLGTIQIQHCFFRRESDTIIKISMNQSISTIDLEKTLQALEIALKSEKTDLHRDATIQRFEFCVELSWKTAKKKMGSSSVAPKVLIREMADQGLIYDVQLWFEFLEARNLSSHTYKEDMAEKVYQVAAKFLKHGKDLLAKLKAL